MEYKVSIIVPVFKAELYVGQCIDSLLNQTIQDIEIILLDDESPDNSGKICDEYSATNDNIKVFHLENGGPSKARNIGIQHAHGKYIGFVDSDDYVELNMFETLYNEAENNQADLVMCSYMIDRGFSSYLMEMHYEQEYSGKSNIINGLSALYSKRYHNGLYSVCNKLFKNSLLQENNLKFDETLIRAEDAWFVFEYLKIIKKVRFINEPLYHYRQVASSTMHTVQNDRYERSKAFRIKLREECDKLCIQVNNNEFYYEFLYESILFCRNMVRQKKQNLVYTVLNDEFFYEASKYDKLLPGHLRFICRLERIKLKKILILILYIWK